MRLRINGEKETYPLAWVQQILSLYGFEETEIEVIADLRPGESVSFDGLELLRVS